MLIPPAPFCSRGHTLSDTYSYTAFTLTTTPTGRVVTYFGCLVTVQSLTFPNDDPKKFNNLCPISNLPLIMCLDGYPTIRCITVRVWFLPSLSRTETASSKNYQWPPHGSWLWLTYHSHPPWLDHFSPSRSSLPKFQAFPVTSGMPQSPMLGPFFIIYLCIAQLS